MNIQRTLLACAVTSALSAMSIAVHAQDNTQTTPTVVVTATAFGTDETSQILTPAKVLGGDELRNKLGSSLGDTLMNELGVSTTGFGAAASRPIIRGLGGPRVKVLQNGMGISDVSTVSEDHAVGGDAFTARQIEILRGPAALLFGSGAIGGLVNIVNDRIPTTLEETPTGEIEARYGTADKSRALSLSADGAAGRIGLHVDAGVFNARDYRIPEFAVLDDPDSASGRLPHSRTRHNSVGIGASLIDNWGHVGASISTFNNRYGIPSEEGAQVDLEQMRYDVEALFKQPLGGIETIKAKLGYTDYEHTELDLDNVPEVEFSNKAFETRLELAHKPLAGWRGTFGMQTEASRFAALSTEDDGSPTVPDTKSTSYAGFLVEEKDFGPVRMNAGVRLESVKRKPSTGEDRSFTVASYSAGGLWEFAPGYGFGTTLSLAQRAPSTEELYSSGPHHATETYDIGDPALRKETSRNIELTLQKTTGLVHWKTNLFHNRVKNFIYGEITGNAIDDDGEELSERVFAQADARIRGVEAEISYNLRGEGLSLRGFADRSRGELDNAGNLPLQPATRFGMDVGYKHGAWRSGVNVLRAQKQDRLASFETLETPAYTRLDANLSYTQRYGATQVTWFALAKNLLNEDIRLSTSLLKETAPQPGRSLIVGVRARF